MSAVEERTSVIHTMTSAHAWRVSRTAGAVNAGTNKREVRTMREVSMLGFT